MSRPRLPYRAAIVAGLAAASSSGAAQTLTNPVDQKLACDRITHQYEAARKPVEGRLLNEFLFDASGRGCVDLAKTFLELGASVKARDRFGNSALSIAARMGRRSVAILLISEGADANHRNLAGTSVLLRAATQRRRAIARLLLIHGADPNVPNHRGVTPLIAASFSGDRRTVEALLAAGANPGVRDATGKGPVVYAAGRGFKRIVTLMLDENLDADAIYGNNLTGLMWAAGHSNDVPEGDGLETVELFLARNVDVNRVDDRGRTALMIAAERGHSKIVSRLLEVGASANHKDKEGNTALDLAANASVRAALGRQ